MPGWARFRTEANHYHFCYDHKYLLHSRIGKVQKRLECQALRYGMFARNLMGKKADPQHIIIPLPRRYISVDTLLILFPELKDKLDSIPSELVAGNILYDALAAADIVNRSHPPVSHIDDLPEDDSSLSDNGDGK